ncbi:hypothetical protein [Butyrivibrio sp. MB2005]|uniref:hypothetical protein n=1 Tax=Butyrivibrio sp. MB2005 TaxID=1280678 RepID=UPI00041640F2|nr:hypothetical protein [Butyrivibrio sp. MB2005]
MNSLSRDELEKITDNSVIVVGTGFVATFLMKILIAVNRDSIVRGFADTRYTGTYYGRKVIPLSSIVHENGVSVWIATHEIYKDEIESLLIDKGVPHRWIYHDIYSLWLGKLEKTAIMPTKEIWKAVTNKYLIAARYLAIDMFYGNNEDGFNIYTKLQSIHQNNKTATRRLERFCSLVKNVDENGFYTNESVMIWDNNDLIDGYHRFAIALYKNIGNIKCDIYDYSRRIEVELRENYDESNLLNRGFSKYEVQLLNDTIFGISSRFG